MYTPSQFEESRKSALYSLMRAHPLATLVAQSSAGIRAEHIPLLVTEAGESSGALHGHVAHANPIWQEVGDGSEVLVIFQGPDHYVSPKWYPSKQRDGRVVPTWNYLVVHVRGTIRWNRDPVWLRKHLEAATDVHEGANQPWRVSDAPSDFVDRMLSAIVGFEIRISDLAGKWKLSQNRSDEDRGGVIAALRGQSGASAAELVEWMGNEDGGA